MIFKENANLIVDSIISLTGNPYKTNAIMSQLSKSNHDFNKIKFVKNDKVLKTITLEGNPVGILKVKV